MSQSCGSKNLSVHKSEMGDKRRMILRKKMRQLLRGIIVLLMATGLAGTAVEADASQSSFQVETTAGDVSGAVGDVVEIPVKISTKQALRGFSGKLSGNYDENILEFQGLDTKELPADAMVSSSGGNFSYLSSSGEHTFSTASYGLKFKILQASEEPVTVTIQDLYYTDGNASSEKVSLIAAVRVNGTGNGAAGSGSAANESVSNAGADSGNHGGATGDSAHPGTEGSNAAGTDSAEEKAQKGGERAESGNDVAAISMDPEDSVSGPANASSDTGADDTGKMVRGKGTTKNGSAPVAVFVIVVVAAAVVGITAGVKISKKRK